MRLFTASLPVVAVLLLAAACKDEKKPSVAEALNARASEAINAGNAQQAIVLLDSAIAAEPRFANAYKNRGNAYRRIGNLPRAIQDYDSAIVINGKDGRYFNDRGYAYQRLHDYPRAMVDLDSAIKLNPAHNLAIQNRGRTEFYMGNFEAAERDIATALKTDSTNIYLVIWLHFLQRRLNKANDAEFARNFARTDTVAWPAPVAQYYLSRIDSAALHRASAGHDSTTTTDQTCAWFFYMGEDDIAKGKKQQAMQNFEQAAKVCPQRFSEYDGAVTELARLKAAPKNN